MAGANALDLVAGGAKAGVSTNEHKHRQRCRAAVDELARAPLVDAFPAADVGILLPES